MRYYLNMSKKEKRIAELLKFPNTMRFSDVLNVLEGKGYALERTTTCLARRVHPVLRFPFTRTA
jgi:hypothetical protein